MPKGKHLPLSPAERVIYKRLYSRRRSKLAHVKAQHKVSVKTYDDKNREVKREYGRLYHIENADRINERHRKRLKDPEKWKRHSLAVKNWRSRNLHKHAENEHRRRAIKLETCVEDCSDKERLLRSSRFCHWCCVALTPETLEIDHVIPLSRGGHHVPDNLVSTCEHCNRSKGKKLVSEWLPFQDFS